METMDGFHPLLLYQKFLTRVFVAGHLTWLLVGWTVSFFDKVF